MSREHAFKGSAKPSKVQQQFRDSTDIRTIMERARKTGMLPQQNRRPIFGEIPSVTFMEAQNLIIKAQQSFDSLPANVRREFGNNPLELLHAFENPAMRPELVRLGLIDPPEPEKPAPEPMAVRIVDDESNPRKKPVEGD